jgi:hypothetical protein
MTRYPVPEAQCNYFTCSRSQINRVGKSLLVSEALQFSQLTAITMKTPCHRDHVTGTPYSHVVFTVCDCFFVKHTGTSGKNGHQRLIEKGVNCMISDANLRSVLIHNFKKTIILIEYQLNIHSSMWYCHIVHGDLSIVPPRTTASAAQCRGEGHLNMANETPSSGRICGPMGFARWVVMNYCSDGE